MPLPLVCLTLVLGFAPALPLLPFAGDPTFEFQNAYEAIVPCGGSNTACCNNTGHTMLNNATTYDGFSVNYNSVGFTYFNLNALVGLVPSYL